MSEQAIEQAAVPVVEAVVKALTPEAEAIVKAVETRFIAAAEHIKAEVDASHNAAIQWLREAFSGNPAATVDPSPAAPAQS
jgi:hypothetical protein